MTGSTKDSRATIPQQRTMAQCEPDHRPRLLRWLLPTSCATAVPLSPQQQAELKLIAFH